MQGVQTFDPDGPALAESERTEAGLTRAIEREGQALGFARIGVTRAAALDEARGHLEKFRAAGHAATMDYLMEGDRHDPRALMPGVSSVISAAFAHGDPDLVELRPGATRPEGLVARYARGEDYHLLLKTKLFELGRRAATFAGRTLTGRVCVDTAPLLERELAVRAGLGFQGKSTLFIAPGVGSYVLLGELLLDLPLAPSEPNPTGGCGSCRACLDACPTAAFPSPYTLDARRCISYLTIEHPGTIPRELRPAMGARVFGCDACQEVCPYNASPSRARSSELGARPALSRADLIDLLELGAARYRVLVKRTALRRTPRATLQRNAAIALGNAGDPLAVAPLTRALRENAVAVVRAHAAWALGELAHHLTDDARAALNLAADADPDADVRDEARAALTRIQGSVDGGASSR